MCHWCNRHGDRDRRWYEKMENYLFTKVFETPEAQQKVKEQMIKTFSDTEWRYSDKEFIRNQDFLQSRANSGFGSQIITKEEMLRILKIADEATKREDSMMVVGHCPCRLVYEGTRDYVCIGFGMPVTMSMAIAYGRLPNEGLTEYGGAEWKALRKDPEYRSPQRGQSSPEIRRGRRIDRRVGKEGALAYRHEPRKIASDRGHLQLRAAILHLLDESIPKRR